MPYSSISLLQLFLHNGLGADNQRGGKEYRALSSPICPITG